MAVTHLSDSEKPFNPEICGPKGPNEVTTLSCYNAGERSEMMDLKERMIEIKKANALDECFKGYHYSICPIYSIHSHFQPVNYKTLSAAHCMVFSDMTDEEIAELKRLTLDAINWVRPWWRII